MTTAAKRSLALALGVTLVGCAPQPAASTQKQKDALVKVRTVAVAAVELPRTTTQPATIQPYFVASVQANASGYIKQIKADMGDVVQAGDVLAVIDVPEMETQRKIIEARVNRYVAEENQSVAGVRLALAMLESAEAKFSAAKSEMGQVEASLAASESEFDRTADLVGRGSLQNRKLDEVRMRRDSQRASRDVVSSSIQSASADVEVARAQAASAKADEQAAKANTEIARRQLEELEVMIDYATIKAPISGVVARRSVEPGDLVGAAERSRDRAPLYVIHQVDKLRVQIPVPEVDAPMINRGDMVTLTFPSFGAQPAIVQPVTRRSGSLDRSTRTMMIEVELDNSEGKFLPGMFGQASIKLSDDTVANTLPARAIRFSEDGRAYVYLVDQDNTVRTADVQTGLDDGSQIEILTGAQPGQRVIDAHLKRFVDGQLVAVLDD